MKLLKLTFGKKIQLLIIPAVIVALGLLAFISFALYKKEQLSLTMLLGLGFIACILAMVSIIALAKQRIHLSKDDIHYIFKYSLHADKTIPIKDIKKIMQFPVSPSEITHQIQARRYIEMLLRSALQNNEFTILFQPKISTKTGRICGAEALVRWVHPDLGWFSPTEFIPIAEESGLIVPLGKWVLKTVCEKLKRWHEMGFFHLRISVNLSAHQFQQGDIVEDIANILWEEQISPFSLDLELTESVLMENTEKYVLMLNVLKSMGITISIDDFGTGYSSLSYLRRFPIDALKIDKSFVSNLGKSQEEDTIIKAIIAMAKGLKIKTIAEGVETKEQANYLITQEVDELQGFYISVPLTEEEFTALLYDDHAQVVAFKH